MFDELKNNKRITIYWKYGWDENTCEEISKKGDVDLLRYAHENGCKWNEHTCASASLHGQLECLKYAHEHGCRWNKQTCYCASINGHLKCLRYAHENGCPIDMNECLKGTNKDVRRYLIFRGK